MPDQKEKPDPFRPGATSISATALNMLRAAIPRLIRGGFGINVKKYGDRYVIQLADQQGTPPGTICIAVITALYDTYVVCDRDDAAISVAKPWALRKGVDFPSAAAYVYSDAITRTATQATFTTESQKLTMPYEVGEELLVCRLPSARILDSNGDEVLDVNGNSIVWTDLNTAGRSWATV